MAKRTVIVRSQKPKKSAGPYSKRSHKGSHTRGQLHRVKRDKSKSYTELPPGPENFIVRTPYPLSPSKEDDKSN